MRDLLLAFFKQWTKRSDTKRSDTKRKQSLNFAIMFLICFNIIIKTTIHNNNLFLWQ